MQNYKKASDATSSPPSNAFELINEMLNEFLNQLPNHLEKLGTEIESLYENPTAPESDRKTNEILDELETISSKLSGISLVQIEKSCGIFKFNSMCFYTEFNIAQIHHQLIVKNAFMLGNQRTITPKPYIEFKKSCDYFKSYMQEILSKFSHIDFDTNLKNRIYFHCYGMICEIILNLNSVKLKRNDQFKLDQDEIADLFRYFVNITNITCNDYDTSDPIKKLLPSFFYAVNGDAWNKNTKNFDKMTLEKLEKFRQDWLEKQREEKPFKEDPKDLDQLVREIEAPPLQRRNARKKKKKPKKKTTSKDAQKINGENQSTATEDNNLLPSNMVNVEEKADRFLAALSASLKQLESYQNKNREQDNLCGNKESIQTENSSPSSCDPFNAGEAEKNLQDEWIKIKNEAKEYLRKTPPNLKNPEYVIIGPDEPSDEDHLSFTNK